MILVILLSGCYDLVSRGDPPVPPSNVDTADDTGGS